MEIDRPFAGDVVGHLEVLHLAALEVLGDNVIGIDIAILD